MPKLDLQSQPDETKNWYKDRYEAVVTQRNFLGVIALASLILALCSGIIILFLVPSKTVMPFLIQVDDKSGVTQIVNPASQKEISADESLRRYFVVKFLRSLLSYDSNDIDVNSNNVRLLANRVIYTQYWKNVISSRNKESLYTRLGTNKLRQVNIKSVQFLDANRAQARLSVIERSKANPDNYTETHHIVLVTFAFENLKLTLDDMIINPLGFQVKEYKMDEDNFR